MAVAQMGQLVWGSYRSVRQGGGGGITILSSQRMIFPWGLESRRLAEIWWHCYNFIPPHPKSRALFKQNPTRAQTSAPPLFGLLLSQFSLTWPSPFWLIFQVSSVLWRTAAQITPLLYPFSLPLSLFPFPLAVQRFLTKVKFYFDVDSF